MKASYLFVFITLNISLSSQNIYAKDVFNPAFLTELEGGDSNRPDLSMFESADMQAPGKYRVDVWINEEIRETTDINFIQDPKADNNEPRLVPCLSLQQLEAYGVRTTVFQDLQEGSNGCTELRIIPGATTTFDFTTQRLLLSIPQAALSQTARGYVSPQEYDDGINALLMNYQFTGANDVKQETSSQSLNLRPGANLGAWRLRNYSTWNKSSDSVDTWDTVYTYAQRNITPIKSALTLGESTSLSDMFDSVPFRGVQLATDDSMEPESQRGYAPVVRGIAKSNAKVSIRQNGYLIYQAFVSPGAFEITDMYSTGGNGDLYVNIEETDGSSQSFIVPYASLPLLRREGSLKYELTSGEYRPYDSSIDKTYFTLATATYGMPLNTTLYGGLQTASKYQGMVFGIGNNLGNFGALSTDITQAWSKKRDEEKTSGQSWRIRYSKNLADLGTNFSIAGYRYSTRGFYTLQDVLDTYRNSESYFFANDQIRNRTELSINQNLGSVAGYLSLSGVVEDHWNDGRRNTSLSTAYSNSWEGISYSFNYSYSRYSQTNIQSDRHSQDDHLVSLSVSIPLSKWLPKTWASYSIDSSNPGATTQRVGLSGTALAKDNLNWSVQEGYSNRDYSNGSLHADYRGGYGEILGGYDYDKYSQRINYGVAGSIIAHANGVTLGQPLGETSALVKATGVKNTDIFNQAGVKTDYRGYAIVPYVTPYRYNDITLDSQSLAEDVELDTATKTVVPTRGAIVRSNFEGNIGVRAFIRLVNQSGKAIPFGATVTDTTNVKENSSFVGDNGLAYLSGLSESGVLQVQWGKKANQQCKATYQFTGEEVGIRQSQAICH